MSQLIRPSALALLATAALTAGATAQVPNSNYTIVPLLGVTGGATAIFANGAANSQLDGNVEIVGFVPTSGQQIWSSDVSFPQGGNDYRLTLALQAQSGTLLPQGHPVNGAPSDRFGIALGDAISGFPIEVGGNEALFVGAITFFALDSAQNYVFGPMDVTSAANLHDPDFGGGWDGSIGFTVPQSMLLGPVHSVQLVIDYRVGQPNDWWSAQGTGCSLVPNMQPSYLELASAAVIGQPMTIAAENVTASTLGLWLVVGDTNTNPVSLAVLGGNPACELLISTSLGLVFMPPDPAGIYDNVTTIAIPNDPALVGAEFGLQGIGLDSYPAFPWNGFYTGQYSEVTIGG